MKPSIRFSSCGLLLGLAAGLPAVAGQTSFEVKIALNAYPMSNPGTGSICTSGATSGFADATVSVVCSGHEFVDIQPAPGGPAAQLLGRTHRFHLSGMTSAHPLTAHLGVHGQVGQATALRVMNIQGAASALHMRVNF